MNPFTDIVTVNENRTLVDSRLITVGSASGQGKTIAIHTMILNYILSGVNVILFSEARERCSNVLFNYLNSLKVEVKLLGNITMFPLISEDTIQEFNKKIANQLKFANGSSVIIIDGPMFDLRRNSFSYKKFKNENTRFVIFEKFDKKSRLDTLQREEENPYTRKRVIAESLRNLAIELNTHIIISSQHRRQIGIDEPSIADTALLYASDIYIASQKHPEKEGVFVIKRIKDRFSSNNTLANCSFDTNNLTFATIK
jgi:hypothetical protein